MSANEHEALSGEEDCMHSASSATFRKGRGDRGGDAGGGRTAAWGGGTGDECGPTPTVSGGGGTNGGLLSSCLCCEADVPIDVPGGMYRNVCRCCDVGVGGGGGEPPSIGGFLSTGPPRTVGTMGGRDGGTRYAIRPGRRASQIGPGAIVRGRLARLGAARSSTTKCSESCKFNI